MNLDRLIEKIRLTVESHALERPGEYARWLWQDEENTRELGVNEYGCADAANIRYMIGTMPRDPKEREACVKALRSFQTPSDGLFPERTHHAYHGTAHCTAALELFEALPEYPLTEFEMYRDRKELEKLLAGLDWLHNPWPQAHQGAGLFAAMLITGNAELAWQDWYFDWLNEQVDPQYGLSVRGAIQEGDRPVCEHLNGWFHYLFNYSFAKRPFPQVHALIDTCIRLYQEKELSEYFGREVGFREIDWVYTLNRAVMQSGYRMEESKGLLREFAQQYIPYLESVDAQTDDAWNDLHRLFGSVCALAELQLALPGELRTSYPLRQILDRRPFI